METHPRHTSGHFSHWQYENLRIYSVVWDVMQVERTESTAPVLSGYTMAIFLHSAVTADLKTKASVLAKVLALKTERRGNLPVDPLLSYTVTRTTG